MNAPNGQRVCVFCGATPLTKEHVIGQWTAETYPVPKKSNDELGRKVLPTFVSNEFGQESLEFVDRGLDVTVQDITVRVVCAECNNGWMSSLELQMKRMFERMLSQKVNLVGSDLTTLERWCLKTSAMWQYNLPESVTCNAEQRAALRSGSLVPGASIRLGRRRFVDRDSIFLSSNTLRTSVDGDHWKPHTKPTTTVTVIALGPLVAVTTLGHFQDEQWMEGLTALPKAKIRPLRGGLQWPGGFMRMTAPEFDELVVGIGTLAMGTPTTADEQEIFDFLAWKRERFRD